MPDTHPDENSKADSPEQAERGRRSANIFLLLAAAAFVGIGLWLADALYQAKRADDCLSSGRRNCAPIAVPFDPDRQPRVVDPRP